ncbi:NADase-type glycan-binding domain-containing protein [Treponema sp.]|uniref:NADase-type glycan-binding domain-containing protein n=1 Tax=Treponema sp. TaxID=166 RepID=UPI00298D738C|nr:hypothetical protein [Treponema sp.]MCR5614063.1 hypothetical protein [Treponema sp.]
MKHLVKKVCALFAVVALTASFSLFANGGVAFDWVEGSAEKITLTNDKDLHLKKEDLTLKFEGETVLVTCEYLLENTSKEKKDIDFAFNIPVKLGGWQSLRSYLLLYKIYDNEKPLSFSSKEEVVNDDPFETHYDVWKVSKLSFEPKEVKSLKVIYKVKTNNNGRFCTADYDGNSFRYNLFPAASFGNGVIDDFTLTIDKTDLVLCEGKIKTISGIKISNDDTKFIQTYSFKKFSLKNNPELVIDYDIWGYYVGTYLKDGHYRSINSISATSELKEGSTVYKAVNAHDGDYASCWVEGASDFGKSQKLKFELWQGGSLVPPFRNHSITHLYILNGFRRDEKTYYENNRIKKLRLTLNSKDSYEITLPDRPYAEVNDYNIAYEADLLNNYLTQSRTNTIYDVDSFDIEILEVYPGTKYNDTCISEVIILNVPQPYN